MQNQSAWHHVILYADRFSEDEQLLIKNTFAKNKKYEHGWRLEFKICILYGDNS
jgi:hypothetical protein